MQLVLHDRSAERSADLLILVRQHFVRDRVRSVPFVVAEESVEAARGFVRPRARDGLHLDAGRAPLRDVEHVRHDLEFRDRFAAELRLPEAGAGNLLGNLLSVEIQLEVIVAAHTGRIGHVVRRDALHELRQLHPVAALQRQLLHLTPVDVSADLRRCSVDERRFAGDGHRFVDLRKLQREGDRRVLTDEELDALQYHGRKARQLRLNAVRAWRHGRQTIFAFLRRDRAELLAGRNFRGSHGGARQDRPGLIGDRTDDRCFLSEKRRRTGEDDPDGQEQSPVWSHNALLTCM